MKPKILIIDDDLPINDPIVVLLRKQYDTVLLFDTPGAGLDYITSHLDQKNIVILDFKFGSLKEDGNYVLDKIRELSKLIPVILWTANGHMITEVTEFINNRAFGMVAKNSNALLIQKVKEAEIELNSSIEGALEDWIQMQPEADLDKPYIVTSEGKHLSLKELLKEIRLQTPEGQEMEKKLLMLTIDLLLRKKESI